MVEKKLIMTVTFLSILFNIFFFFHISNNILDNFLLDKTTVSLDFSINEQVASKEEVLSKIQYFSKKNNVEIAQYSFLSRDKIDIYSTMKEKYKEILFVPNVVFNRDIKVHNFEELLDVGFKNILYIDTNDTDIIDRLSETLKNDCKLYLKTSFENNKFSFAHFFMNKDNNALCVFVFWLFLFILVVSFYYSINQKRYSIYKLWGYPDAKIYSVFIKPLSISLGFTMFLSNIVISGIIYKNIFSQLARKVFFAMLKLNIVTVSLILIISIPLFCLFVSLENNGRKKRLTKMMVASYFLRILLFTLITFSLEQFFIQSEELKEKFDSLTAWENTENLYNLYESYSPLYLDDLAAEDIHNEKIFKVYKELSDLDRAFIIKTTNFERPETGVQNEQNLEYRYHINVEDQEDLYSPYGKNIVVDRNYLKKHILKSVDGKNVIDMIDNDNNTLNILVPQKFERYESTIATSFKEWFHFQKIEVANIYKTARGQKKVEKSIDDLSVNIIYIENGQNLFTYNPNSGNGANIIDNAIITVYTENVDNSFLAACMGDYIFIESTDEYSALKEISTISQKHNITELNSIASVYDKKGEEIRLVEESINNLIVNTVIMSLFSVIFMIAIVYMYYKSSLVVIIIKSLYGYGFWEIYKHLILVNSSINIIMLFIVGIVFKKISLYMIIFSILMTIVDCFVSKIVNRCLITKGELQFITGE